MRIVYATDNYWPRVSGMAVSIDTFREELERQGHEVILLAPEYPGAEELDRAAGRKVYRLRSYYLFFSPEDRLMRFGEEGHVFQLLDSLKPDLIHVQTELNVGKAAWRYAKARRLPLVLSCHTYWEQYVAHYIPLPGFVSRFLVRFLGEKVYNLADALVVPSKQMLSVLHGYGVDRPAYVIPTGLQLSAFAAVDRAARDKIPLLAEHPALRGKRVLLTVTRVAEEKNVRFLLEAVTRLLRELPDLAWLVVGDGPSRAELTREVASRGLGGRVVFTGYLERRRVQEAFALAELFLFASKTESQGLVTVEAMGCGVPVVAIGEMGTAEVMGGDNGGYMVPEDQDTFVAKARALLTDPALYRRKSEEARAWAERWSAANQAARMARLYARLVARGPLTPDVLDAPV